MDRPSLGGGQLADEARRGGSRVKWPKLKSLFDGGRVFTCQWQCDGLEVAAAGTCQRVKMGS